MFELQELKKIGMELKDLDNKFCRHHKLEEEPGPSQLNIYKRDLASIWKPFVLVSANTSGRTSSPTAGADRMRRAQNNDGHATSGKGCQETQQGTQRWLEEQSGHTFDYRRYQTGKVQALRIYGSARARRLAIPGASE